MYHVIVASDSGSASGGAENVAILTALELHRSGREVSFLCGSGPLDPRLSELPSQRVKCLDVSVDQIRGRNLQSVHDLIWRQATVEGLESLVAESSLPTILHIHSFLGILSPSTVALLGESTPQVVLTLHDYGIVCPNSGLYNHRHNEKCSLRPMSLTCVATNCGKSGYLSKLALVLRNRKLQQVLRARREPIRLISVSHQSAELIRPFLAPDMKIEYVRNPRETRRHDPFDVRSARYIQFVGRLVPEKDPVRIAAAARKLNAPVRFVGDGPLRDEVLKANPDAVITGWVSPDLVQGLWSEARVNVMSSRWHEGNPLSIGDAAALGIPSIVPKEMAGSEDVVDDVSGATYSLDSQIEFLEKLRRAGDDDWIEKMGSGAYGRYWQNPPTMQTYLKELTAVYESVLR